jgi:hypothetical protein
VNWKVDYVLTHTCPSRVIPEFFKENTQDVFGLTQKIEDPVSKFFDFLDNRLEFKEWHFGHLHKDQKYIDENNDIYYCHYNECPMAIK